MSKEGNDTEERPKSVGVVMKRAIARSWKHLQEERIGDTEPTIPLGENLPLSRMEMAQIKERSRGGCPQAGDMPRSRDDDASVDVVDAAY